MRAGLNGPPAAFQAPDHGVAGSRGPDEPCRSLRSGRSHRDALIAELYAVSAQIAEGEIDIPRK